MRQHTVQVGTFGINVSDRINELLRKNPDWRLTNVFNVEVSRVGATDRNVILVFEAPVTRITGGQTSDFRG